MARQIDRDCAAILGEGRLGEHPAIEISAEPVDQHDRGSLAAAEIEHPQAPPASLDVARRGAGLFRFRLSARLGRDKAGDKGVDFGIGHGGGRRHGEQRANQQGRAGLGDDAAQGAALRGLEDIGDLARLDF